VGWGRWGNLSSFFSCACFSVAPDPVTHVFSVAPGVHVVSSAFGAHVPNQARACAKSGARVMCNRTLPLVWVFAGLQWQWRQRASIFLHFRWWRKAPGSNLYLAIRNPKAPGIFVYCHSIFLYIAILFFCIFFIFFYFFLFFLFFCILHFYFFVYFCTLHLVKKAPGELPILLYIAFLFFCILHFYFFVYCIFIFLYVAFALAAPACVLAACAWLLFGAAAACLMRAQCVGGMVVRCTHVCHRVVSHAWCTRQLVASP
jgi:hypothetical protein